jgi:KDO2-lipid IV(A) lauroyltransferase
MREQDKRRITKIRRAIKYPILVFFIRVFILVVRIFPRSFALKSFAGLGGLVYRFLKKEREKTINNLTFVFGGVKSESEIKEMARRVFVNQAMNFADYVHTMHYTTRQQFSKIVDFVGEEHLAEVYKQGNGVLCLMCHVGSWEFSAIMPPVMGYETTAISRPMPNEKIDRLIVRSRQKRGMKNISRGNVYDQLVEVTKKGECLIIMIDQDTQVKGVFLDFMGKQAYTPIGAARLAIDTKAPVLPMYIKRLPNNRHQFTILPPLPYVNTGTESDIIENTKIYNQAIEKIILETPEQWVWMHERWKTTPEDVEKFLQKKREKAQLKS